MAYRFTKTVTCNVEDIDSTVASIVKTNQRDRIEASNNGQIELINVSITSAAFGKVLVCCLLGEE